MKLKNLLLVACALGCSATLLAQQPEQAPAKPQSQPTDSVSKAAADTAAVASADKKETDKKKEKEKKNPYEELVKKGGFYKAGMFGVRNIEKDWYFEVSKQMLGRQFLSVTRYTNVPQGFGKQAGEMVDDYVLYFELRDTSNLVLRSCTNQWITSPADGVPALLSRASSDPILMSFNIIGQNTDSTAYLIKTTNLFKGNNVVTGISADLGKNIKLGGINDNCSFVDSVMVFDTNIEIRTTRTYSCTERALHYGTNSVTLSLNTSLVLLPEEPMRPRFQDERVGYFVSRTTKFNEDRPFKQYNVIARFKLEPKDKAAYAAGKLVEPVEPIIFYIDPLTPAKWVPYLKQGVDDWNEAFKAAGFKNAIQGREWPKDRPDMSVDDARYNVIRYLPSTIENAYGPHISDPRSGQILESHIGWYHNVINLCRKWYTVQCGPLDKRAQTVNIDDELMGQLIRFVSSHEVGHTLGLRHNMVASSATPVEKLRDKAWLKEYGHTSSIMDYARFNYVAQPEDGISPKLLFPRINDYDKWAIKWGYQYRPEFKDAFEEQRKLRAEVTQKLKGNIRLRYVGDEGRGNDPRSQTEDLGDNAVLASTYGIKNLKRVVENLEQWTAQPDCQYDDLQDYHTACIRQFNNYCKHVRNQIFGRYTDVTSGQPERKFTSRQERKAALQWVADNVFQAPDWLYPASIQIKLQMSHPMSKPESVGNIALRDYLLYPDDLVNLYEDQLLSPEAYTLDEYFNDLFQTVWKPLSSEGNAQDNHIRNFERVYVSQLDHLLNDKVVIGGQAFSSSLLKSEALIYVIQHIENLRQHCEQQSAQYGDNTINALHFRHLGQQLQSTLDTFYKKNK